MPSIVLIGAPGSGKSTLARKFTETTGDLFVHISSGAIARQLAAAGDDLAKTALRAGMYAPEASMRAEIHAELERAEVTGKIPILDGFPRMIAQLVLVEMWLSDPPIYIEVLCPQHTCLQRVVARKREDDDQADAIASRFESYSRDTVPMLEMLRSDYVLRSVDTYLNTVDEAINVMKDLAI